MGSKIVCSKNGCLEAYSIVALCGDSICHSRRRQILQRERLVALPQEGLTDRGLSQLLPVCQTTSAQRQLPFLFSLGKHQTAGIWARTWQCREKGVACKIWKSEYQAESAVTDLHPQTGRLLPRTRGSQVLEGKEPLGEGERNAVGGT